MFIGIVCLMIYCMVGFPISNSIDVGAAEPANISMDRSQMPDQPEITPFRTAQVYFLEMLEKTPPTDDEAVKLSKKEKNKLVEQGVIQFHEGERAQAKETLEQAKTVFPTNYTVPYYLGLIYLEEGWRSRRDCRVAAVCLDGSEKRRLHENSQVPHLADS